MSTINVTPQTLVSKPMLEKIIAATCMYFSIEENELLTGTGTDQVYKKHLAWYLIKDNVAISSYRIAQRFNIKAHSSVLRAVDSIQAQKNIYAPIMHDLREIMKIANTLV
jgi:chromosomal replication initiation ATPase DnaA